MIGCLPEAQRQRFGAVIHEKPFRKGEVLSAQGERAQAIRIVKTGTIMVGREGQDGKARPVAIFGRGEVAGKFGIFDQNNELSFVAASSGRYCEINNTHMKTGPYLAAELQDTVARAYVRSYERLADWAQVMRIRGVTDRLAATLLLLSKEQHSHLVRLPGHSVLADLLGITRESIVRALAHLQRQQCLVRHDATHYQVLEPAIEQRMRAAR
jgi:CRP-like cAMP-binding protein